MIYLKILILELKILYLFFSTKKKEKKIKIVIWQLLAMVHFIRINVNLVQNFIFKNHLFIFFLFS